MTKRAGKKKRRAHVAVVPEQTTTENGLASAGSTVTGSKAGTVVPLSGSQPAQLSGPDNGLSVFWPELDPSALEALTAKDLRDGVAAKVADAKAAERAETTKRLSEWRIEIAAVNKHYNIPQALRDRMVYEAARTMTSGKATNREKLAAMALLRAMDAANRGGDLPAQIQVTNNVVAAPVQVAAPDRDLSPQAIVAAMLERPDVLEAIDAYEFKDSGEDYAS